MRDSPTAADFGNSCICLGVRRAARMVARRYDDALRPHGLTSGQFSILSAMLRDRPVALGSLAELLGMDRTTLNRNLKPLDTLGLIETTVDKSDARVRGLGLTTSGRRILKRAMGAWNEAQAESNRRLGEGGWAAFQAHLRALG